MIAMSAARQYSAHWCINRSERRGRRAMKSYFFLTFTTDAVTPLWLCRPVLLNGLSKVCSCSSKQCQISSGVGESAGWKVTWALFSLIGLLLQWFREHLTPCGPVRVLRIGTKRAVYPPSSTWYLTLLLLVIWIGCIYVECVRVGIMEEREGCFQLLFIQLNRKHFGRIRAVIIAWICCFAGTMIMMNQTHG